MLMPSAAATAYFYPRPLRGGRHYSFNITAAEWVFLSTPSARRATDAVVPYRAFVHISIHALCEEGDNPSRSCNLPTTNFYPRPLRGGRRQESPAQCRRSDPFLSTPSARRATRVLQAQDQTERISIHALCEEGDLDAGACNQDQGYFYPRPLRGGRRAVHRSDHGQQPISIHALCEEGDSRWSASWSRAQNFYPRPLRGGRPVATLLRIAKAQFLSTPSARRATDLIEPEAVERKISIHALCEEGDSPSGA